MFRTILRYLVIAYSCLLTVGQDLERLRNDLRAANVTALFADDAGYANASLVWNRRFKLYPAAIAFPTTVDEVSAVVKAGAAQCLQMVPRSGGHSFAASSLGGKNGALVVDLSKLNNITVHENNNTVVVETGSRLGNLALTLNGEGLAVSHGTCTYLGMGGHTGYGGFGYISRKRGLALDNLLSAIVVLANGTIVKASCTMNSDLFWAMRGSAGSFAIATSLEFSTFPAPLLVNVFNYFWDFDVKNATNALLELQKFAESDIPPELGASIVLFRGSSIGTVVYGFIGAYYGPADQFLASIAPYLSKLPTAKTVTNQEVSYIESLKIIDGVKDLNSSTAPPEGHDTFYAKSIMTPEDTPMSPDAIQAFFECVANEGFTINIRWSVDIELYGGSNSMVNSVPLDATAFAHRNSLFTMQFFVASWNLEPPYPSEGFTFANNMVSSIVDNSPKDWDYGAYPNYLDDLLPDWQQRYYGPNYQRLRSIKDSVDPKNLFNFPTSIEV